MGSMLSRYAAGRERSAQLLLRQHLRLGQAFHVGASAPVAMTMDKRLSLTDCPKCKPPARSMVGCPSISRVCPECGGGGRVTPLRREQLLSVIDLVGLQLQVAQQVLKPDWCRLSLCGPSAPALGARHLLPDRRRRAAANAAAGLGRRCGNQSQTEYCLHVSVWDAIMNAITGRQYRWKQDTLRDD